MRRIDQIKKRLAAYQTVPKTRSLRDFNKLVGISAFEKHAADDVEWLIKRVERLEKQAQARAAREA